MKNIWTQCFLSFLEDRKKYKWGHPFYPISYEDYLMKWHNDFCND